MVKELNLSLYVCVKHINNYRYAIYFPSFYKSEETNVLVDIFIENTKLVDVKTNSSKNIIYFSAKKVVSFLDFLYEKKCLDNSKLSYKDSFSLFEQMYLCVNELQEKGYSFTGLDINNLIVVDDSVFLCLDVEHLVPLNENGDIRCIQSFSLSSQKLYSPEILNIKKLPCLVSSKCIYYSIGLLIFYCLFGYEGWMMGDEECSARGDEECSARGDKECSANGTQLTTEQIESELQKIESTKLYWIILSCLKMNPEERKIT